MLYVCGKCLLVVLRQFHHLLLVVYWWLIHLPGCPRLLTSNQQFLGKWATTNSTTWFVNMLWETNDNCTQCSRSIVTEKLRSFMDRTVDHWIITRTIRTIGIMILYNATRDNLTCNCTSYQLISCNQNPVLICPYLVYRNQQKLPNQTDQWNI